MASMNKKGRVRKAKGFPQVGQTSERWVIVKIREDFYKVLTGWSGSYMYGASWILNRGVQTVREYDGCFIVNEDTSSCYILRPSAYGYTTLTAGISRQLKERGAQVLTKDEALAYLNGEAG